RELERDQAALGRAVEVLATVDRDQRVAVDDDARVRRARGHAVTPQRIARARVDAHDVAAAGLGVEHALAAALLDAGHREGVVERRLARRAHPQARSGALVEGVEAVTRGRERTPRHADDVHDDAVLVDQRRTRAAVWKGQLAVLLDQGVLPQLLAVA